MSSDERKRDRPHDLLFRYVFAQVAHARGPLRFLVGDELAERLEWSTLRLEPGVYVEEHLRDWLSDLSFSIDIRGSDGLAAARIIWEHLRKPRRFMPLHLLNYGGRALRDYTRSSGAVRGHVPLLIPVVLYQGKGRWMGAKSLSELHGSPGQASLPTFMDLRMMVHELRYDSIPPEPLTSVARTALRLLWLVGAGGMVHRNARRVAEWLTEVHDDETAERDDLHALFEYIYRTQEERGMIQAIEEHMGEQLRGEFVSVADRLEARGRAEGEARGRAEGEARGRAEGEARGKAGLLLQLLRQRFERLPAGVSSRVREGTAEELDRWGSRLLSAATVGEVFEDS